ncbi:hypothetical protein CXG81DRAFT_26358 [Caulochytrium protostelioides]|uniref:Uncharacterized protein n=1 Tax=Caulochytrium protostelioides TaxID=1555241 RepID=A0A4P9X6Y8_9FUNG|nr:hypothetical protein CXG81DRAFT_26358 [Caulochytrium protostelioides]|eukprot:RKP00952.1 hypothetical protein CXG81DRAFT_26358 [Caulochytrium protostelioides]
MPVSTAPVNAAVDATARWVQAATREPVTLEQAAALSAPLRADEITVDPLSGLTYLRLSGYLARLKAAFGDVVPPPLHLLDAPTPKELMRLQRHLGPGWRAVDPSHENDGPRDGEAMPPWVAVAMTALVRLGKDLGIALELWEAGVAGRLRDQGPYVRVWVSAAPNATGAKGAKKAAQGRYQWVRKSAT